MPTLTLRNIPEPIYERLKARAAHHRRSLNGEMLTLLEEALLPRTTEGDPYLALAEEAHARVPAPLPDLIREGIQRGREGEATP